MRRLFIAEDQDGVTVVVATTPEAFSILTCGLPIIYDDAPLMEEP